MFNLDNLPQRGAGGLSPSPLAGNFVSRAPPQLNPKIVDAFHGWGINRDGMPQEYARGGFIDINQPPGPPQGMDRMNNIYADLSSLDGFKKGGKVKKRKGKYNQKQKQKQSTNIKINIGGDKGGSSKAPQFIPQYIGGGGGPQMIVRETAPAPAPPVNNPPLNVANLADILGRFEARLGQPIALDAGLNQRFDELQNLVQQGLNAIPQRPPPPMSHASSNSSLNPNDIIYNWRDPNEPVNLDDVASVGSSSSFGTDSFSNYSSQDSLNSLFPMSSPMPPLVLPALPRPSAPSMHEQEQAPPLEQQIPASLEQNNQPAQQNDIIPYRPPPPPAPPILRNGKTVYKLIPETIRSPAGRIEYYFYKTPNGSLFAKRAFEDPNALPRNYTNVVNQHQRHQAELLNGRFPYNSL